MNVFVVLLGDVHENSIEKIFLQEKDAEEYIREAPHPDFLFIRSYEVIE